MPTDLPPPPPAFVQTVTQQPQAPLRIPETDMVVEVVGALPLQIQLQDLTRLLGQRLAKPNRNRSYPPTILELIRLVNRNPQQPRGRQWISIREMSLGYDAATKQISTTYCVDYCTPDPKTRLPHPKRKMVTYRAPEAVVASRLKKKLGELVR